MNINMNNIKSNIKDVDINNVNINNKSNISNINNK